LVGRAGPAYRTATQLELRRDHAAALDAVHAEIDIDRDFGSEFIARWGLFEVTTEAQGKTEFLMRPDLGRRLGDTARLEIHKHCAPGCDLQVAIGDGLSATAVAIQIPELLPRLEEAARGRGWTFGRPFVVRYCRVGVLNDIGALLYPSGSTGVAEQARGVVVLLIGERPGLATAESLSAYMAWRPQPRHTDAHRNLISNIHSRGITSDAAADRIMALAEKMCRAGKSGVDVKEDVGVHRARTEATSIRLSTEGNQGNEGGYRPV
jgi:ethanolamine ammonia-lyase small subunit